MQFAFLWTFFAEKYVGVNANKKSSLWLSGRWSLTYSSGLVEEIPPPHPTSVKRQSHNSPMKCDPLVLPYLRLKLLNHCSSLCALFCTSNVKSWDASFHLQSLWGCICLKLTVFWFFIRGYYFPGDDQRPDCIDRAVQLMFFFIILHVYSVYIYYSSRMSILLTIYWIHICCLYFYPFSFHFCLCSMFCCFLAW